MDVSFRRRELLMISSRACNCCCTRARHKSVWKKERRFTHQPTKKKRQYQGEARGGKRHDTKSEMKYKIRQLRRDQEVVS